MGYRFESYHASMSNVITTETINEDDGGIKKPQTGVPSKIPKKKIRRKK